MPAASETPTWKQGVSDLVDTIKVRHKSGGWSTLGMKVRPRGQASSRRSNSQSYRCFNAHPVLTLPVWVDSYLFIRTLQ
jgi:hypothetical protein